MSKIAVVYWSGTGNTEAMASSVAAGAAAAGAQAEVFPCGEFDAAKAAGYDAIAFGCPAMGAEELEADEFEPLYESCRGAIRGKRVGLFGSYGWGDGEWMRNWEASVRAAGAVLAAPGVICCDAPDAEAAAGCEALGRLLAEG